MKKKIKLMRCIVILFILGAGSLSLSAQSFNSYLIGKVTPSIVREYLANTDLDPTTTDIAVKAGFGVAHASGWYAQPTFQYNYRYVQHKATMFESKRNVYDAGFFRQGNQSLNG